MKRYFLKITLITALAFMALSAGLFILRSNPMGTPQENAGAKSAIQSLDSRQLAEMLKTKDFTLINVHVPYDGEIEKTDAFIAYDTVNIDSAGLPSDKSAPIVVYCKTGRMSRIAADELVGLGYKSVYDLTGGMDAWQTAGYRLSRNGTQR